MGGAFSNGRSWLHHAGLGALFQSTSLRDVTRPWVGHERCTAAVLCVQHPCDVWREVIRPDSQLYSAQYLRGPEWCRTAEAHFVIVRDVVLSVRRISVEEVLGTV